MSNKIIKSIAILCKYITSSIITTIFIFYSYSVQATTIPDKVKSYISNIKSIAVEFEQKDSNGNEAKGMLIIDKPYKFRCNYYEPFPLVIIGNKNYVSVYDYEMQHLSRIKAHENIFNFLLIDKINFDDQFEILEAKETDNNYEIKLRHLELDRISKISFNNRTKQINLIKIFEDTNIITLTFGKTHDITNVAESLFIIQNPDVFGIPDRLTKEKLEKSFQIK